MGVYDCYGEKGIQLKVGPCELHSYAIGDIVKIRDGVYIAPDGVVVISGGKFVASFDKLYSKWGDIIEIEEIVRPFHPLAEILNSLDETKKEK